MNLDSYNFNIFNPYAEHISGGETLMEKKTRIIIIVLFFWQVQFHGTSTVVQVANSGGASDGDWITLYRLAYSVDCTTFQTL